MTDHEFRAWTAAGSSSGTVVDDNKTPDDPIRRPHLHRRHPVAPRGPIDDADPATLQLQARHHRPGYNVVVRRRRLRATYTSAEVATLKNTLVVADRVNGAPLTLGTASIKNPMTVDESASWKPIWPLKLSRATRDLRQPQAGRRRAHQHRAGRAGSPLPFDQGVSADT